ncbi:MAG: hypothetical protein HFE99_05200 [Ruminiclostridium sp.]|jgi:hypothetical protein|nr:hypothetical protein [Ruminiclostridium sp.]
MSRTENSLRNIKFALFFQAASILVAFLTRKVFVLVLTQEYLGLDGTFSNILTMLSLAELGIGGAITYSLYKPLAQDDRAQITALMALFRRVYWSIGGIVALLGCALAPLLPVLIRDMPDLPHIYLIYMLFVLNTALSYFGVYKQSLIIADQRQYITSTCHYGLKMLLFLAQALFLWLTHNYFVYLGLMLGATLAENLILTYQANRLYPYLKKATPAPLPQETRKDILRNTKALLTHRVGGIVVFGTDNLLISAFVGVISVGLYSNYLMVTNGLKTAYGQLFRSLTASVGNLGATKDSGQAALPVYWKVNFVGGWLFGFSAICLAVLLNPFIDLWLGEAFLFRQEIVCLIALNFYVTGMREATLTFRDAYGLYWYDRHKPIAESLINLAVSAALAIPLGVAGIFLGTFISTMTTCFWIEPVVLFHYGFHAPVKRYFQEYAVNTLVTLATGAVVWWLCTLLPGSGMVLFCGKAAVCLVAGNLGYLLAYHRREEFRYFLQLASGMVRRFKR